MATQHGIDEAAAFLFGAGSRRAQQAEPILASMCAALYNLPHQLLKARVPWSLTASTSSAHLLHPKQHTPQADVGVCGSDAFQAMLEKGGGRGGGLRHGAPAQEAAPDPGAAPS